MTHLDVLMQRMQQGPIGSTHDLLAIAAALDAFDPKAEANIRQYGTLVCDTITELKSEV